MVLAALMRLPEGKIAPGVFVASNQDDGWLNITFVVAESEGSGDVGRWLDTLPRDRPVKVVNVISERLAGMLRRRGFVEQGDDFVRG